MRAPGAGPSCGHRRAEHRAGPRRRGRRGGGGGGGGWRLNLAPTPELLARVAALRPVRDFAQRRPGRKRRATTRSFNLRRLLREFRRPLLVGLVLVVIDALASLAGPILVKTGIDNGVSQGLARPCSSRRPPSSWSSRWST